jgi:hypothetical protein
MYRVPVCIAVQCVRYVLQQLHETLSTFDGIFGEKVVLSQILTLERLIVSEWFRIGSTRLSSISDAA